MVGNYYRHAAEHVVALLDELGIDRVHLLGNSLGGGTAMRLALSYPDRVGRLVLMGPGGLSLNLFHADPTEGVQRLMDFGADPTPEKLRAFISTMVVNQALVTDELVAERFADATAPGAREAMRSMGMSFWNPETAEDGMLWREAHQLRKHTLLTWGREDRVNPLDGAMVALKLIPKASLHVFPNCGHWAQIEAADEFAEISTAFLARHVERTQAVIDIKSMGYVRVASTDLDQWTTFAGKVLGLAAGRGPEPGQPVLADRPGLRPARRLPLRRRPARRASAGSSPTTVRCRRPASTSRRPAWTSRRAPRRSSTSAGCRSWSGSATRGTTSSSCSTASPTSRGPW